MPNYLPDIDPSHDRILLTDGGHTRVSPDLTIPVFEGERREATGLVWTEVRDGMSVHRFGLTAADAVKLATDLLVAAGETEARLEVLTEEARRA
jgi:hypothetical protein